MEYKRLKSADPDKIAEIAGMNSTSAGELIRRFGREITKSKELTSILNNSEKLLHE